jgi:hypothetical protein
MRVTCRAAIAGARPRARSPPEREVRLGCYRAAVLARSSISLRLALLLAWGAGVGCDDLKDFEGTRRNAIVGGNFVRSCFKERTELTLVFNPSLITADLDEGEVLPPNSISTDDGTFQNTRLEPISRLSHDPLSELDFPGPQRLRNYMLLARPETGPLAGRDALVVVSLLASDTIEVRVIARPADGVSSCPSDGEVVDAGSADPLASTTRREYFGLWRLKKP